MSTTIDIRELPARLEEALTLASAGGEVILVEGTVARARLVAASTSGHRVAGLHQDAIQTTADFDAPLPDDFWVERL